MPASSNTSSTNDSESNDFVLKHRVAGAAVILFFGALVLPWLLGTPSEAKKDAQAQLVAKNDRERAVNQALREELLASLADQQELPADQVYVSKITPLSKNNDSTSIPDEPKAEAKTADKLESSQERAPKAETVVKESVDKKSDPINSAAVKEDPFQKPAAVAQTDKPVAVGWIVQVGVFTDQKGVTKVINDLKSKGFSPSTSIVDTNKGKGTRIWLGPYEERIAAAQIISNLSEKTGESGFIRSYP